MSCYQTASGRLAAAFDRVLTPVSSWGVSANSAPDRLVVVTPMLPILRWARRNRVRVLATLAEFVPVEGLVETMARPPIGGGA